MTHLSDNDLARWRDTPLEADRGTVVEHLAACDQCAGRFAELIRTRPLEHVAPALNLSDFKTVGAARPAGTPGSTLGVARHPMRWVLAAAAVVLTVLTWQTFEGMRLRSRLAEAETAQSAQAQQSAERSRAEQSRIAQLNRDLQDERSARAILERELAAQRDAPRTPTAAPRPIVSLFLTIGRVRSGGEARRVTIPADAVDVRLMLDVGERAFPSYTVTILNADGVEVWTRGGLPAGGQVMMVSVPANVLPEDDYEIVLDGVTQTGAVERVGDYYFTVLRS